MVFFGKARWEDHAAEHGAHGDFKPHESPSVMLVPLVVLAGLSIVGGIIQLPSVTWLPDSMTTASSTGSSRSSSSARPTSPAPGPYDNKTILMLIATAAAVLGIIIGFLVYEKGRIKANEPTVLANAWYYDQTVSDFMGGPGRESFEATAWFDATSSTARSTAPAGPCAAPAGELRKGQTGYVRSYAAIIGLGVVGLLVWFVVVRGIL